MSEKITDFRTSARAAFTLVETLIVLVIVALLAAMAFPAMDKVREKYRERAIIENLDTITMTGLLYMEERGLSSVDFATLEASGELGDFKPVAGEDYGSLKILSAGGTIQVQYGDGNEVDYAY